LEELFIMSDRCAVLTTLNGEIVEWRVFDSPTQAMQHYTTGVGKLQEMIQHTDDNGVWEIMLCDVKQYALSRQNAEHLDTRESEDWYSRYLTIMAGQARRISSMKDRFNLRLWHRLKGSVGGMFSEDDEPTIGGT
jgi:hypothetical protein